MAEPGLCSPLSRHGRRALGVPGASCSPSSGASGGSQQGDFKHVPLSSHSCYKRSSSLLSCPSLRSVLGARRCSQPGSPPPARSVPACFPEDWPQPHHPLPAVPVLCAQPAGCSSGARTLVPHPLNTAQR